MGIVGPKIAYNVKTCLSPGITLDFDINLDPSNAPYEQVFKTLANKFVEPLTGQ